MNMMTIAAECLKELEAEAIATRKCLEGIPETKFEFKPHPTSMALGYLALLVAEIPKWITVMIQEGEVDFKTFQHAEVKTTADLVTYFDDNMRGVKEALGNVDEKAMDRMFYLKNDGQELFSAKTGEYISTTINHYIHHRGQLTVYMRICEIPVPAIYGPSGDDKNY